MNAAVVNDTDLTPTQLHAAFFAASEHAINALDDYATIVDMLLVENRRPLNTAEINRLQRMAGHASDMVSDLKMMWLSTAEKVRPVVVAHGKSASQLS